MPLTGRWRIVEMDLWTAMRSISSNLALSSSPGTGPASSASSLSVAGWTAAVPNATAHRGRVQLGRRGRR
jgi:hypothetical protein